MPATTCVPTPGEPAEPHAPAAKHVTSHAKLRIDDIAVA
jgi:hypothetical protein